MKFSTTPYHFNLLKDTERLSVFYEAINNYFSNTKKNNMTILDIGCGSGILSYFIAYNTNSDIIAIECDLKTFQIAKENLKYFKNISIINKDILDFQTNNKIDLVVCEMLDTGLIDEAQVPALNHIHNFLNENYQIIPEGVINIAEVVKTDRDHIHYEDDTVKNNYETISNSINYLNIDFKGIINPKFKGILDFKINKNEIANGVKITTITKIYNDIICSNTPMFNPPLFIPIEKKKVLKGDNLSIELEYIMGSGLETIKTKIR